MTAYIRFLVKKYLAIIVPCIAAAILAANFSSCEKYILPSLEPAVDTLFFKAAADSSTLNISSNVAWQLSCPEKWVSLSTDRGKGDASVSVKVSESTLPERKADLTVSSETFKKTVVILQQQQQ